MIGTRFWNDTRLIPAFITMAIGGWLCWQGFQMPRPHGWSSSPGLFPVIIGSGLIIMAFLLLLERQRLIRQAAVEHRARQERDEQSLLRERMEEVLHEPAMTRQDKIRTAAIAVLIGIYAVSLNFMIFEVATFLFLVAAMLAFGERSVPRIVLASAGTVVVIAVVFIYVLETLLPGNGSLVENFIYG
ncbi:tripartite tricarboxylate transporter TctB family protein [Aureimonas fodinaquatilis]|uniref:Tripartite tricarboxylate transporter TctB family protein n=1 Tax=Aureimonas fodinaquatilis TaxID=2565783 RepID=A0A5B0DZF0_9HYPH|nr:tripartite tricarboxylate transporter TctB family protein [Aureimonas fodinaquatilis]KAA0972174.1 tripartite tricarboxylate transporter TctB family protein [Aureimonas fodinaquatilis]